MARVGQPLGSEIVREGDVVTGAAPPFGHGLPVAARARRRHILVERPQEGAMVDNYIVRAAGRQRVGLPPAALRLAVDAGIDAPVAPGDVVRFYVSAGAAQSYSRSEKPLVGEAGVI